MNAGFGFLFEDLSPRYFRTRKAIGYPVTLCALLGWIAFYFCLTAAPIAGVVYFHLADMVSERQEWAGFLAIFIFGILAGMCFMPMTFCAIVCDASGMCDAKLPQWLE